MKRIIALDLGTVRIGVAVTDPLGTFAQGVECWDAASGWMGKLGELMAQYGTDRLLLGLPRKEDGTEGEMAAKVRETAGRIAKPYPQVQIRFWDERYTSRVAQSAMIEGDLSRRKRKGKVDQIAASLILQNFIDAGGAEGFR